MPWQTVLKDYGPLFGLATISSTIISTLLSTIISYFITKKNRKAEARYKVSEARYKAIVELAYCLLNYDQMNEVLKSRQPKLASIKELTDELYLEWANMVLYASNNTVRIMKAFIEKPTQGTYSELVLKLRGNLYGVGKDRLHLLKRNFISENPGRQNKGDLKPEDLIINKSNIS